MKLSIIMPCFNVESTLVRALDSIIMQQTNFEYEIIVVNDASNDHTAEIAKQYSIQYPQIIIIDNELNKGNAYSYYVGLCASKGEYFCVLDGDDYYTISDKLQRQVDFLDADTENEYVGTATQYIIDLGNNMVSIPPRSNFKWMSYADFLTQKTEYYHTSTYMYRNIFRGNVPSQIGEVLYRGDTPRTMFHLLYSGKKIRILDFVGSAYTFEFEGIWSGLRRKEQYAYQISYLTQHRENVLTDFERLSADKQIKLCQEQMDMASNDFKRYPSISIEQALKYISEYAGKFAFAQKDFVFQHVYASSYIDTLCASLGYVELIRNPQHIQNKKNSQHICIVNGILNPHGGGIFAEIEELVDIFMDKTVYLLVTEMMEISKPVMDILSKHSNLVVLCPPKDCTERLRWFREQFVKISPYRTYYYCSHKDTYGAALVQNRCCENITLFSFDHGYLCGILNPNLDKIVAKRPTDYWMLKKTFKEKVIYIPAWSNKERRFNEYIPFKEHDKLITASGAARFYKVDGRSPYRYIDYIVALLKRTEGIHYHFGELSESMKKEINEKLKLNGIAQNKFVQITWVEDIPSMLLDKHVDIFIEPFPVVSYKLTLEVLSVGVPVIAYKGLMRMNIADFLPSNKILWSNQEEFLFILSNLTKEELLIQSRNVQEYFDKYHNSKKIGRLLQETITLGEPEKYIYSDDNLIDITDSFRLFGDNFKIEVMNQHKGEVKQKSNEEIKLANFENMLQKNMYLTKNFILNIIEHTLKRSTIEHLDFHVVEHCNLNCKGCSVFSPIANPCFANIKSFEHDMRMLYNLVGDNVQQIHLLGGEPLLHPEIEKFAKVCRSIFTKTRIDITTNGLRIFDMTDTFWNVLRENKIAIKFTQYPIQFDYQKMIKYVEEKGIYVFSAGPKNGIKYFRRIPLNLKAVFNMYHSFIQCPYADCVQLRDGKLYHCPASAFIYLLNKKIQEMNLSKEKFHLSEGDYLELSKTRTSEEVFQFLSNAIPFCQYCDMDNMDNYIEWNTSKKDIHEWVDL